MYAILDQASNLTIQRLSRMEKFATRSLPHMIGFGGSGEVGIAPCRGRLETEHFWG